MPKESIINPNAENTEKYVKLISFFGGEKHGRCVEMHIKNPSFGDNAKIILNIEDIDELIDELKKFKEGDA